MAYPHKMKQVGQFSVKEMHTTPAQIVPAIYHFFIVGMVKPFGQMLLHKQSDLYKHIYTAYK